MKINTKKGFSLIELSIVLIIIGLLVAGITGGASLIKSAELRSTMSEIRNYETAINAYYVATGSLPGTDHSSQMNFANSGFAWGEMQSEGIIDSNLSNTASSATVLNADNSPASRYKGAFYALGFNITMNQNVLFLFGIGNTADNSTTLSGSFGGTSPINASITRKDARFIDEKMDNGKIDSGKVRSFSGGGGSCVYEDADETRSCTLAIGIGLQSKAIPPMTT